MLSLGRRRTGRRLQRIRSARKARKPFETDIVGFTTNPSTLGQPDDKVLVQVAVPRAVWNKMKAPTRVRFL